MTTSAEDVPEKKEDDIITSWHQKGAAKDDNIFRRWHDQKMTGWHPDLKTGWPEDDMTTRRQHDYKMSEGRGGRMSTLKNFLKFFFDVCNY